MVIKLNEGFSGEGNAILDLRSLAGKAPQERVKAIGDRFHNLRFQATGETWENFSSRIPELGAIAEAFIEGEEKFFAQCSRQNYSQRRSRNPLHS